MADSRSEVAERYAEALFELALEEGALETVEADMKEIGAALEQSDDLRRLVESPVFDHDVIADALSAVLEQAGASLTVKNFVKLLARNGRASALAGVVAAFAARAADHRGEVSAEAVSAAPLSADQEKSLRQQIEAKVGKSVVLTTRTDASLLGGLVVKVGSKMIDSSLRTKLNRLQQSLKEA